MEGRTMCLSWEEAAAWIDGGIPAAERDVWTAHLESCASCRERLSAVLGDGAAEVPDAEALEAIVAGAVRAQEASHRRPLAWAAAAAVLLGGGWALLRPDAIPDRTFTLPEGRHIAAVPQPLVAAPGHPEPLTLPDGSRVRLGAGTRARLLAPGPGERIVIELAHGTIEAEAVKDPRSFRVTSEAGEIHVVGTAFTAKALRVRRGEGGSAFVSVFSVEVSEGAVDLIGDGKTVRVAAGKRGIARDGHAPSLQEMAPWDWRTAVRRLGGGSDNPGFAESLEAATLLAGTWSGDGDWSARMRDVTASPEERRIAAFLARISSETE